MKAVLVGAGGIGRGLVAPLLHEGGYELVFSDASASLIDAIGAATEYTVHEIGEGGTDTIGTDTIGTDTIVTDTIVTGFRAVDGGDPQALIDEIATADIVTTTVGATVLPLVAPQILAGLALRDPARPPLQIMACEDSIGATDVLRDEIRAQAAEAWDAISGRAVFANAVVDRIVSDRSEGAGIDVTVEPFFEWTIERPPFGDAPPHIPGARLVDDLAPYADRTLLTVSTARAAAAYLGARAGATTISDALADPAIADEVAAALRETSALLVAAHGWDAAQLADDRATTLRRLAAPALSETVGRGGRAPLSTLSRHGCLLGPAAAAAERGLPTRALVTALGAALEFDEPGDAQSVELQRRLREEDAATVTSTVTGLPPSHPLFAAVEAAVRQRQSEL